MGGEGEGLLRKEEGWEKEEEGGEGRRGDGKLGEGRGEEGGKGRGVREGGWNKGGEEEGWEDDEGMRMRDGKEEGKGIREEMGGKRE